MTTQEATTIELSKIDWDNSAKFCQMRDGTIQSVIDEYAEWHKDGNEFPPVTCYSDGKSYWLVDGFHRCEAAMACNCAEIQAVVHGGDLRDAILEAVRANAIHGLNRTVEDKRRAVMTLLNDETWRKWSAREIARRCGVSNKFVSALKRNLSVSGKQIGEPVTCERNGTTYEMETANIGTSHEPSTQTDTEDRPSVPNDDAPVVAVDDDFPEQDDDFETCQNDPPQNKFGAFYDLVYSEAGKVLVNAEPYEYAVLATQLHTIAEEIERRGE